MKLDALDLERELFNGRVEMRELKRRLNEPDGDEELLISRREKKRKRDDQSTGCVSFRPLLSLSDTDSFRYVDFSTAPFASRSVNPTRTPSPPPSSSPQSKNSKPVASAPIPSSNKSTATSLENDKATNTGTTGPTRRTSFVRPRHRRGFGGRWNRCRIRCRSMGRVGRERRWGLRRIIRDR
jgi:hypothetical protein